MTEPVGDLLDSLGVVWTPEDGDLPCAALVLLKVVADNGEVTLRTCYSDGLDWITRLGMLRAAEHVELPGEVEQL